MLRRTSPLLLGLIFAIGSAATAARADNFTVNSAGTYLLTSNDPAPSPTIIDLSALTFPVHDGDILHMARFGHWSAGPGFPDTANSLAGLFSTSTTILASNLLNRVPGALAAGTTPFVSSPTFFNNLSTDIPQDFFIDDDNPTTGFTPSFTSIDIKVPVGARYLLLTTYDSHYSTNNDPNADFGISITQAVPEPAGLSLLGVGTIGLLLRKRRRA